MPCFSFPFLFFLFFVFLKSAGRAEGGNENAREVKAPKTTAGRDAKKSKYCKYQRRTNERGEVTVT